MPQIIRNVQLTWAAPGIDLGLVKGFNVALVEAGKDPKDEVVAYGLAGPGAPYQYVFRNVVLDNAKTYKGWVQTLYPGDDSDWVSTAGDVSIDDGTATIATQAEADAAEANAKAYADGQFVDSVTYGTAISDLQGQIDGAITTWFLAGVPTLANAPANTWTDDPTRNQHLGDVYYDDNTGFAYRFKLAATVYSWVKITDSDVTQAIQAAANAQDTADSKRRVFVVQPVPPYDPGDLWDTGSGIKRSTATKLSGGSYAAGDWTDAADVTDYAAAATTAQTKADAAENNAKSYADSTFVAGTLFRVVSRGANSSYAQGAGLWDEAGGLVSGTGRSYRVSVLDRAAMTWVHSPIYDVYGNDANATAMAAYLNALDSTKIVVVYTSDEPDTNNTVGGLDQAIYRCGGSQTLFDKGMQHRGAYILVGIPGIGEGQGIEVCSTVGDTAEAWVDTTFTVTNGNLALPGGISGELETPTGAQSKADTAQGNAEATAAADATSKANSAQSAAEATAAADAIQRANDATPITLVVTGAGMNLVGAKAWKSGGGTAWDHQAYSKEAFSGGAFVSATVPALHGGVMFGLDNDPTVSASYASIDYAIYINNTSVNIYESGVSIGTFGTWSADSTYAVVYNGQTVRYMIDGVVVRAVNAPADKTYYFDSSFRNDGAIESIKFGPVANIVPSLPTKIVGDSDVVVDGITAKKISGGSAWNAEARSLEGYSGGIAVSWVIDQNNMAVMAGINPSPAESADWTGLDYCFYFKSDGKWDCRASGSTVYSPGVGVENYVAGDRFAVIFDGSRIRYKKNGVEVWTEDGSAHFSTVFHFDSSLYTPGASMSEIAVLPLVSNNWSSVGGAGKPADNADVTDYGDSRVSNNRTENSLTTIPYPGGGTYSNGAGGQVGAIQIKLPQSYTNTMLTFEVDVYDYYANRSFTLLIAGYTYNAPNQWLNVSAVVKGSGESVNHTVRFGNDGGKCCVWIGETNTTWNYPKASVRNFQAGYASFGISTWDDGWFIGLDTSFGTVDKTITDILPQAIDTVNVNGVASATVEGNAQTGKDLTLDNGTVIHASSINKTIVETGVGGGVLNADATPFTLVANGPNAQVLTFDGGKVSWSSVSSWTAGFYSKEKYTGGCALFFRRNDLNANILIGLNADPDVSHSYNGAGAIDYALYPNGTTNIYIYEGGNSKGVQGSAPADAMLGIVYDNDTVYYLAEGVVIYSTQVGPGLTFGLDATIATSASIESLTFGPFIGQYQATKGATWGTDLANQPTELQDINEQQGLLINSIASDFAESFDGPDPLANWEHLQGAGERWIVSVADSAYGGKVMRLGNNAGVDEVLTAHKRLIPFDPTRVYRIRVRVKRVSGTSTVYLGFAGVAADGVTGVNYLGGNSLTSNCYYHTANNQQPTLGAYQEFVGYTQGFGAPNGTFAVGTEQTPGTVHENVRYLRPIIFSAIGTTGQIEIDSFIVESKAGGASTWSEIVAADGKIGNGNAGDIFDANGLPGTYIQDLAADKIAAGTITASVAMNALAFNGGSMNINNKMIVASDGTVTIQSATTGARMVIQNDVIKVYDAGGVLRVKMGNLLA